MRYYLFVAALAVMVAADSAVPHEQKDSKPVEFGERLNYYRYDGGMYPSVDGYGDPQPRDVRNDGPYANRNNPNYNRRRPTESVPPAELLASDLEAIRQHRNVYGHAHDHHWVRTMPELTQGQLERYERDDTRLFERIYDAAQDSDSVVLEPTDPVDATNPAQVFNELLADDVVLYDHVTEKRVQSRRLVVVYLHELLQSKQRHCAQVNCESMDYKMRVYSHPLAQEVRVTEHFHLKDRYAAEPHQRFLELFSLLVDPDSRRVTRIERLARFKLPTHYDEPPQMSENRLRLD